MARIARVIDNHSVGVEDDSHGFTHIQRPLTGVTIHIGLTEVEAQRIENALKAQRLHAIIGRGWQYSRLTKMLTASYSISDNPWGLASPVEIAQKALEAARKAVRKPRQQR